MNLIKILLIIKPLALLYSGSMDLSFLTALLLLIYADIDLYYEATSRALLTSSYGYISLYMKPAVYSAEIDSSTAIRGNGSIPHKASKAFRISRAAASGSPSLLYTISTVEA